MKAFQLLAHGAPGRFELREVPDPEPGPDEVIVQVVACGLNRLDLWLEEASRPIPLALPRMPGGKQEELDWPWPVPSRPEVRRLF